MSQHLSNRTDDEPSGVIKPSSKAPLAIQATNMVKTYRQGSQSVAALRALSFDIPAGCIFSILGPNGAGKTTLIRILTTLSRMDSGSVSIQGFDLHRNALAIRQKVGVVFQKTNYNKYLSIWQNLTLHADMHRLDRALTHRLLQESLEAMDLWERRTQSFDELSGGQQRRLAITRALLHQPDILFLDEPSTGLDPHVRQDIWKQIKALKSSGKTVILTTHYMEEAEQLSDELMMMNDGQHLLQGSWDTLKETLSPRQSWRLVLRREVASRYQQDLKNTLYKIGQGEEVQPGTWEFSLRSGFSLQDVLDQVSPNTIEHFGRMTPTLESLFIRIAKGETLSSSEAPQPAEAISIPNG